MSFKITELKADFAVEVTGLDLSQRLSAEDFCAIREAWFKAGVMVIRDQYITPAEQVAFSRQFGSLGIHVLDQFQHPDQKEILICHLPIDNNEQSSIAKNSQISFSLNPNSLKIVSS